MLAYANPTELRNVTVNASDLHQTQVNWLVKSEFKPTRMTLYANPGNLTDTVAYTDTSGISDTEPVTIFAGIPVAQIELTELAQLNNALGQLTADLTKLESGTYHLWLEADDGVNPSRKQYAFMPGTQQLAVITIDNQAAFPTTWTPVITPTINMADSTLDVWWTTLDFPDIDSYTLHLGTAAGQSEWSDENVSPVYRYDEHGAPVEALAGGRISNIEPNQSYYFFIAATDEESGRLVKSQTVSFTVSAGDYALTTPATTYQVAQGSAITIPLALAVNQPLFNPDIALGIQDEALPRGIVVQFDQDLFGQTSLHAPPAPATVQGAGVSGFAMVNRDAALHQAAQPTVNARIRIGPTVAPGAYPITFTGYNVQGMRRSHTIQLQVGATGIQAQTMCYGDNLDVRIPVSPAAAQVGVNLVVITGLVPPNLTVSGAQACVPYTGFRSMIELTNQLVTQGCADGSACHPITRLVFEPDGSYRITTIQEVQTVSETFLPLVANSCSEETCE